VKAIADPQGRGRQYLATFLSGLAGTHAAGFVLTRQEPAGMWTDGTCGLVWWLKGSTVSALSPEHAAAGDLAYGIG
jgi:hypothetical protein